MAKRSLLILLFLLTATPLVYSQTVAGKYAGEFLAIGVGGRPLGMGGAFTAVANDVTAAYYNPAGLAALDYPQLSLMHDQRYGNLVNYNYALASHVLSTLQSPKTTCKGRNPSPERRYSAHKMQKPI